MSEDDRWDITPKFVLNASILAGSLGLMGYLIKQTIASESEVERNVHEMDFIERLHYRDYSALEFHFHPVFDSLGIGLAFLSSLPRRSNYLLHVPIATFITSVPEMVNGIYGHLRGNDFLREVGTNFAVTALAYAIGRKITPFSDSSHIKSNDAKSIDDEIDEIISNYESPSRNNPEWWSKK